MKRNTHLGEIKRWFAGEKKLKYNVPKASYIILFSLCWISICKAQSQGDTIQFSLPGDFISPFDYLNIIPANGLDLDNDMVEDIVPPCSCRELGPIPNGTLPTEGVFDDQLIIATGVSGQSWRLGTSTGVLHPESLQALPEGTSIPEIGNSGIYVLPFAHKSDAGYLAFVKNLVQYPEEEYGPITKVCHYPFVQIENIETAYCDHAEDIILSALATSAFDGYIFPLIPEDQAWEIKRLEDNEIFNGPIFSPSTLGEGTYEVSCTFDAGHTAFYNANNTACNVSVTELVEVRAPITMACNSAINITLNPQTCFVTITSALLLASNPDPDILLNIDILDPMGQSLGNTIFPDQVGQTLLATITDECTGLACTSSIIVNDLSPPNLDIPDDITLRCTETPLTAITGEAMATDCSDYTISYTDVEIDNGCANPKVEIQRTWTVEDMFGNSSTEVQRIFITRAEVADLRFPDNKTISCADYQMDSSIADPIEGKGGRPNLIDIPNCGLIYTYEDDTLTICGDPNYSFAIIREWNVLDLCGFNVIETDGLGNDNIQVIQVVDEKPPQLDVSPPVVFTNLSNLDNGLDNCSSTGFIEAPIVSDECNLFDLRIFTAVGELVYTNGMDGQEGGNIPFPGLEIGEHEIIYEAEDACGNDTTITALLTIVDDIPPIMVCKSSLNLTLLSTGEGRIFPEDIDVGSRDDCCEGDMRLKKAGEPDAAFLPYVDLFCENDTVDVVLRVWDCYGNYNDCTASISVIDAIPPVVDVAVPDLTLSCLDDYILYLDGTFEAPQFSDNCNFSIQYQVLEEMDNCGIGKLTRTWTARDNDVNPPTTYTQIIEVEGEHEYRIQLPADTIVDCIDTAFQTLDFTFEGCDMIAITAIDDILSADDGNYCYAISRKYQMVNWCEYDVNAVPFEIPRWDGFDLDTALGDAFEVRSDGIDLYQVFPSTDIDISPSVGYYTYQQLIKVVDNEGPSLAYVGEQTTFCTSQELLPTQDECTAYVALNFALMDNCADTLTILNSLLAEDSTLIADPYGLLLTTAPLTYRMEGFYPVGQHSIRLNAIDPCGNIAEVDISFEVEDCTLPMVSCPNDTTVTYPSAAGLELTPDDLLVEATDNCGLVISSFAQDTLVPSISYSCAEMGTEMVKIYVKDEAGNEVVCNFMLTIEDSDLNACLEFFDLTGHTHTESGFPISSVDIGLEGPFASMQEVNNLGEYAFMETPEGEGYQITPNKDINHDNGLSVIDLILINRHIVNVALLDSPYRVIAADADRSGDISVLDLIFIRRLILGIDSVFAFNTSWRFIPEDYEFLNPLNPLQEGFPERFSLEQLSADTSANFIGVKVGDVDETAASSSLMNVSDRSFEGDCLVDVSYDGNDSSVKFHLEQELLGCQMTIAFDPNLFQLEQVIPGEMMDLNHFSPIGNKRGELSLCWYNIVPQQGISFKLKGNINSNIPLDQLFSVKTLNTDSEVVTEKNGVYSIFQPILAFNKQKEVDRDIGNYNILNFPNPFISNTKINFYLAESGRVVVSVYNSDGKLTHQIRDNLHYGYQQINIEASHLDGAGVYYYKINSGDTSYHGRMILLAN